MVETWLKVKLTITIMNWVKIYANFIFTWIGHRCFGSCLAGGWTVPDCWAGPLYRHRLDWLWSRPLWPKALAHGSRVGRSCSAYIGCFGYWKNLVGGQFIGWLVSLSNGVGLSRTCVKVLFRYGDRQGKTNRGLESPCQPCADRRRH